MSDKPTLEEELRRLGMRRAADQFNENTGKWERVYTGKLSDFLGDDDKEIASPPKRD